MQIGLVGLGKMGANMARRIMKAGHTCVVISSGQDRALLLGDAVTCPLQLDEPTWHSVADVDPALADRTRERLWRELEEDRTTGVGAHFPELQFGRVLPGTARRWFT